MRAGFEMNKKHELLGLHHITAITSDIKKNYTFFTEVLGMRLVKKSVNQDDIQTYHTYYGDDKGSPGTAVTFFDFPNIPKGRKGTNTISRIGFRVPTDAALDYYQKRFETFNVKHSEIVEEFGTKVLSFQDEDEQLYQLISDEHNTGMEPGIPWKQGPVPEEHAIYGLGRVEIKISYAKQFIETFQGVFGFKEIAVEGNRHLMEVGEKGNGAQVIIVEDDSMPDAMQGYGEIHHVAFRLAKSESLALWKNIFDDLGLANSGYVNRFYFESLYVRVGHILVELATDDPGFDVDEPYETLGETLALPPFLENKRAEIESQVRPFDTRRSNK